MQNFILRVSMWVLGLSALIGNACVIVFRFQEKPRGPTHAKQRVLIGNLAVSDCLMGVYMVVLASVDLYYRDQYFIHSDVWRSSFLCKLESFLSLLSSEASILFITLITLDRFLSIVFPFSSVQFRGRSTKIAVVLIWVVSFLLGFVPTYYAGSDSDLYDLSDVCVGLPLITRPTSYNIESSGIDGPNSGRSFDLPIPDEFKPAWYFSIAIFLVFNFACFLFIFILYTIMFIHVKLASIRVKHAANRSDDIKMAVRMAAIVGTDFLCWVPVIIMGILSQIGAAVIPLQMYTWSVVFILPINSSLNPYLYTIASLIGDYKKAAGKRSQQLKISTHDTKSKSK